MATTMATMTCDAPHGARGARASAGRIRSGARMMRALGGGGGGGRCVVRCDARAQGGGWRERGGRETRRVCARAGAAARMRAAAVVVVAASGMRDDEDEDEDDVGFGRGDNADDDDEDDVGTYGVRGGDGVSSLDGQFDSYMMSGSYGDDEDVVGRGGSGARGARGDGADWDTSGGVPPDDIISESSQHWFDNSDEWYEPTYKEVNARKGSVLEKVQRMHLNEPSDFSFKDGEYFDLMGYVKEKTDNEFCLVLEVAERARERKIERLESLGPQRTERLGPIQQAIADLALEVEMSGGKTSAYLAMREAADRARLRYELQQASWCWDKYCEDSMRSMGVSEKAEQMLHMGERQNEAMDFERDLLQEDSP